jgi:hypothetical protein
MSNVLNHRNYATVILWLDGVVIRVLGSKPACRCGTGLGNAEELMVVVPTHLPRPATTYMAAVLSATTPPHHRLSNTVMQLLDAQLKIHILG